MRITGKQKREIDPDLLVQVLLAIARDWDSEASSAVNSPDAFNAAVQDRKPAP
jgi:hypothetical protein